MVGGGGWSWGEVRGRGMWWAWGVGGATQFRGRAMVIILFVRGVTERISLNLLFSVSCTALKLSSCVGGGSDSISGEATGSSM